MKTKVLLLATLVFFLIESGFSQGTVFTYQGKLDSNGSSANGTYDLRFRLSGDSLGTALIGGPVLVNGQFVTNGLFTVLLDFGSVFNGSNYWLQVDVKTNGAGSYTTLAPLQPITPTPYAIMANSASNLLGSLPAGQLTGTVGTTQVANDAVTSTKILDGTIANADLGNNSVTSTKILDGSIVGADMAANTVGSDQLADVIALGKSNVVGQLDVFYSAFNSNQPSISLLGSASQISTYGSDGKEQIRLWGSSWGELLLHDNTTANDITAQLLAYETGIFNTPLPGGALRLSYGSTNRVYLKGGASGGVMYLYQNDGGTGIFMDGDSGGAGYMDIRSTNGAARVVLDGSSTASGGEISVNDGSGTESVQILGAYGTGLGGNIQVRQSDGNVGVEIASEQYAGDGGLVSIKNAAGVEKIELDGDDGDGAAAIRLHNAAGTTTISLDGDLSGDGRITTQELQITGGSDLSEQFDINAPQGLQPGMVVCIDPQHPGELRASTTAYDRTVAGVVSGAGGVKPGMLMGQHGTKADGKHPVALTGRVYVLADASHGAIFPGDLLTTSSTAGHAMKVSSHDKAQGAVLGKAMSTLSEGKGLVLVLVSLQ